MKYSVIENRNIGTIGAPIMHETVLYRGNKEECLKYEEKKRKEYTDRTMVDCFIISDEQQEKSEKFREYWDLLSKEEKEEKIVIDGKTYFKAAYEFHNK